MKIVAGRHGQSDHNAGKLKWEQVRGGNAQVPLSKLGHEQSRQWGKELGPDFLKRAKHHVSPFLRASQTHEGVLRGADLIGTFNRFPVTFDPRLAEMDFGGEEWTLDLRKEPGGIYGHVFVSGKSFNKDGIADMRDFVADLRATIRNTQQDQFIVCHGWTCLLLVMAWFDLLDDVFNTLENLDNCAHLTIAPVDELDGAPVFEKDGWGVTGIRFRD